LNYGAVNNFMIVFQKGLSIVACLKKCSFLQFYCSNYYDWYLTAFHL